MRMQYLYFVFLFVCYPLFIYAQPLPNFLSANFIGTLNGTSSFSPSALLVDDHFYVAGDITGSLYAQPYNASTDVLFAKLLRNGTVNWATSIGSNLVDQATSMAMDSNYLYIYGLTNANTTFQGQMPNGGKDVFVTKADKNTGTIVNTIIFGSTQDDDRGRIAYCSFDGTLVVTWRQAVSSFMITKINSTNLSTIWTKNTAVNGTTRGIKCGYDGSVYATGSANGNSDIVYLKLNSSGSVLVTQTFTSAGGVDCGHDILQIGTDVFISGSIGASYQAAYSGQLDPFILKVTESAGILSGYVILNATTGDDEDLFLAADLTGNILVYGRRANTVLYVNKLTTNLTLLWQASIQGTAAAGLSVDPLNSNNFVVGCGFPTSWYNQTASNLAAGVLGVLDSVAASPSPTPSATPSPPPSPYRGCVATGFTEAMSWIPMVYGAAPFGQTFRPAANGYLEKITVRVSPTEPTTASTYIYQGFQDTITSGDLANYNLTISSDPSLNQTVTFSPTVPVMQGQQYSFLYLVTSGQVSAKFASSGISGETAIPTYLNPLFQFEACFLYVPTSPSPTPSLTPSVTPSSTPSSSPTRTPSVTPSVTPSPTPSRSPSLSPSVTPSMSPSSPPSSTPTRSPSVSPTSSPTPSLGLSPSPTSSVIPSVTPSSSPTSYYGCMATGFTEALSWTPIQYGAAPFGQTFTASASGYLDKITIRISPTGSMVVSTYIYPGFQQTITPGSLGTYNFTVSQDPSLNQTIVYSPQVAVTQGQQYSFLVNVDSGSGSIKFASSGLPGETAIPTYYNPLFQFEACFLWTSAQASPSPSASVTSTPSPTPSVTASSVPSASPSPAIRGCVASGWSDVLSWTGAYAGSIYGQTFTPWANGLLEKITFRATPAGAQTVESFLFHGYEESLSGSDFLINSNKSFSLISNGSYNQTIAYNPPISIASGQQYTWVFHPITGDSSVLLATSQIPGERSIGPISPYFQFEACFIYDWQPGPSPPTSVTPSSSPSLGFTPSPTASVSLTPASTPSVSPSADAISAEKKAGNKNNKAGVIAGSVVGVAAAAGLVAVGVFLYKKRANRKRNSDLVTEDNDTDHTELPTLTIGVEKEQENPYVPLKREFNDLSNIQIKEVVGAGNFGEVYRGIWNSNKEVALKKLRVEKMDEFLQEASMLQQCSFDNVVTFYGLHRDKNNELYMVTEFMSGGALNQLLQNEGEKLPVKTLIEMARDAANGIKSMSEKGLVHRDLAARNLLVHKENEKYTVKVADFGLARHLSGNYYTSSKAMFPIKWSAPEVLKFEKFSAKSDVWSFGIVLWEIFEFGSLPYPGMSNNEATTAVLSGYRLPQPAKCPDSVYKVMLSCWNVDTVARPTFQELYDSLHKIIKEESFETRSGPPVVKPEGFYANAPERNT